MLTIGRDPFARESISAELVRTLHGETCAWCGQPGRRHGRPSYAEKDLGITTLYLRRYRVTPDSGRSGYVAGAHLFCSIDCARSYIGE